MGVERHDELLDAVVVDISLATARQLPEDELLRLQQVAEQHARTADGVFVYEGEPTDDGSADAVMAALSLYNGLVLLQHLTAEHTATMEERPKEKPKKETPDEDEG